jgi:thymidylate kinase
MKKGKFIVFLGVDGVGKSSITHSLKKMCEDENKDLIIEHWRPNLFPALRNNKEIYTDNVNQIKTSENLGIKKNLISLIRYFYYTLDFFLGYQFKLKKQIKNGNTFIIERYFFDNMINPHRYKFFNPFLDNFIYKLIAKPDLLVLLTCDPKIAFERKNELSIEELQNTQEDYLAFLNSYEFTKCILDTTNTKPSEIANDINRRISR